MGFLDFFLVTCRVLHVFSVVGWLGGLGFLGGVAGPVLRHFGDTGAEISAHIERRFVGFVWMTAWGAGVSGVLLMLLNNQFLWFDFSTTWRVLLLAKQVLFLVMIAASLLISRSLRDMAQARIITNAGEDLAPLEILRWRVKMLYQLNLTIGILAIVLAAAMR